MKNLDYYLLASIAVFAFSCNNNNVETPPDPDPGESTTELLVTKFATAPIIDGQVDAMWSSAQRLVGTAEVPTLGARNTYLNSDGKDIEETLGLFYPYSGEKYKFTMRGGYFGENIYLLVEWEDGDDSKDRVSWYFDPDESLWKQEHKYANDANDKFYEDKMAFQFPIGEVTGFSSGTCYATCHTANSIAKPGDKHTRHYLSTDGQKVDMWHWKRVRGSYLGQIDDKNIVYDDPAKGSSASGRKADQGESGYSNNKQTLSNGVKDVSVPKYVIPNLTNHSWITEDDIGNGTAELITGVDVNGVLSYEGGSIDPTNDSDYSQAIGNKRFPSILTKAFTGSRGDISIKAEYTGTGWIAEITRKMNTGNADDVAFKTTDEMPFGFAIFNNAAIAHGIKPGLVIKFEQ
jgi:ethylbenzene dehydrogenase